MPGVTSVRVGKMLEVEVDGVDEGKMHEICRDLLSNPVIEDWVVRQAKGISAEIAKEWHGIFRKTSGLLAEMPERVTAPVLLVAGAKHVHGCEPPLLDKLRKKIKHARKVIYIPHVAIGVQLLAADACAAVYLDFLGSLKGEKVGKR